MKNYTEINQDEIFLSYGFIKHEHLDINGVDDSCYEGPTGAFFRIDHFSKSYVMEVAANNEEKNLNIFEDTDLFDDSMPQEELINEIKKWIETYALE